MDGILVDFAEAFDATGDYVGEALIARAAWVLPRELGIKLSRVVSLAAFECRLAESDRIDFCVFLKRDPVVRARLALSLLETPLPCEWSALQRQLLRWALSGAACTTGIWIEVDAPSASTPAEAFLIYTLPESSDDNAVVRVAETRRLAEHALGLTTDDPILRTLDTLTRSLPAWSAVRHLAIRPQRDERLLRAICRVPTSIASEFALGGSGSPTGRAIDRLLAAVHDHPVVTNLNFDLTDRIRTRLGLEFDFSGSPADDVRWPRLFDALESLGLLTSSKRQALEVWPTPRSEWNKRRNRTGPDREVLVKVDFDEKGASEAKAYLIFDPTLSRSGETQRLATAGSE